MRPANERRRYNVTSYLIGWAHAHMIPGLHVTNAGFGTTLPPDTPLI